MALWTYILLSPIAYQIYVMQASLPAFDTSMPPQDAIAHLDQSKWLKFAIISTSIASIACCLTLLLTPLIWKFRNRHAP